MKKKLGITAVLGVTGISMGSIAYNVKQANKIIKLQEEVYEYEDELRDVRFGLQKNEIQTKALLALTSASETGDVELKAKATTLLNEVSNMEAGKLIEQKKNILNEINDINTKVKKILDRA